MVAFMLRQRITLLLLLVCALGIASYAYAQTLTPPAAPVSDWLVNNLWAIVVCAFNIGLTWRQMIDLQRRVVAVERCIDVDIPETYVRKDVLLEQMQSINRELKTWRESFSFLLRRPDRRQGDREGV